MQITVILRALGLLLCCEAGLMLPSLAVALIYGDGDARAFVITIAVLLAAGLPLALLLRKGKRQLFAREGFALVALAWLLLSAFGALPYMLSGVTTSYADALFESISGFTTTGATILRVIEGQPRGILFWRSFSNWIGGIGVLVFTIAILPALNSRNMEIMRAESTGPLPGKVLPRLRDSAKALYGVYLGLSLVMLLTLLLTGMPLYDAFVNMLGTAGTGGFSVLNSSIGGYQSAAVEIIIAVFMLLFSVNFSLYFALLTRDFRKALRNEELWLFGGIVLVGVVLITISIYPVYQDVGTALRYSFFQTSSIVSSSGFSTADFALWPTSSHVVLLFLMALGGCAGSSAGGLKVSRLLLMGKAFRKDVWQILHPRIVKPLTIDGKAIDEKTVRSVFVFFFAYIAIALLGMLILSFDPWAGDLITTSSAVMTTISNAGPGLGAVGPMGNYADFSVLSKLTLSLCMLIGRLEIMPILLLFSPALWRRA